MRFRLTNDVSSVMRTGKSTLLHHVGRVNFPIHPRLTGTTKILRSLNTVTVSHHHHRSVLPLVNSAINFSLPSGPFDDPAATFRASCNVGSVSPEEEEQLLPMFLCSASLSSPIGFLRPMVTQKILENHHRSGKQSVWNVLRRPDDSPWAICFAKHVADFRTRTNAMRVVLESWKTEGLFHDVLKGMNPFSSVTLRPIQLRVLGWSNETYPVYTPRVERSDAAPNLALGIERAGLPLFGFSNFGCLLTAFYNCSSTNKTMLWIPRRSLSKSTWPGRYDCTVGGGMGLGETPNESIVRECTEEASLPSDFVKKHARSTGMLNFMNRSPSKWILPGIYYLYELRLPNDDSIMPCTNVEDGEVDAFQLMDIEEVLHRLLQEQFKPSSAMALVDFCIRRGIITPESDPAYLDVCMAMRRQTVLPLP